METKEIIKHALKDYQNITGLRSYVVYDNNSECFGEKLFLQVFEIQQ